MGGKKSATKEDDAKVENRWTDVEFPLFFYLPYYIGSQQSGAVQAAGEFRQKITRTMLPFSFFLAVLFSAL